MKKTATVKQIVLIFQVLINAHAKMALSLIMMIKNVMILMNVKQIQIFAKVVFVQILLDLTNACVKVV